MLLQLESLQIHFRAAPIKLLLTQLTHGNNAFSLDWLDDLVYISYFCSRFRTLSDIKLRICIIYIFSFPNNTNYCGNVHIYVFFTETSASPESRPCKEGRGHEQISQKRNIVPLTNHILLTNQPTNITKPHTCIELNPRDCSNHQICRRVSAFPVLRLTSEEAPEEVISLH